MLVYDGLGGRQGVVTAEYLAAHGAKVEFVTWLGQAAPDLAGSRDWGKTYGMLRRMGVRFSTDLELVAIEGDAVRLRDIYTKEERAARRHRQRRAGAGRGGAGCAVPRAAAARWR